MNQALSLHPTQHFMKGPHVDLDCHFIREKVIDRTIKLMSIRTQHQLAVLFNKPLPKEKMDPLLSKIASKDIFHSPS